MLRISRSKVFCGLWFHLLLYTCNLNGLRSLVICIVGAIGAVGALAVAVVVVFALITSCMKLLCDADFAAAVVDIEARPFGHEG